MTLFATFHFPMVLATLAAILPFALMARKYPAFFFRTGIESRRSGNVGLDVAMLLFVGAIGYLGAYESFKNLGLALLPPARPTAILVDAESIAPTRGSRTDYVLSVSYANKSELEFIRRAFDTLDMRTYQGIPEELERRLGDVHRLPVDQNTYARYRIGGQVPVKHVPGFPYLLDLDGNQLTDRKFWYGLILLMSSFMNGPVLFQLLVYLLPWLVKEPSESCATVSQEA